MKVFITVCVVVLMSVLFVKAWDAEDDTVTLSGYKHAVALCDGEQHPDEDRVVTGQATLWRVSGITYVVNKGHENDSQIADLVSLASIHCQQYFSK